ncbi:hypothetical protein EDC94DRAFT_615656 [Helicostylum pulchrum]|nr:hypothetical protein EDC94DRAFT_615656 [Helicostylum pulchrum]
MNTMQQLNSTNRAIYGAATITLNNTIYVYGGFYNVAPWDKEALWTLSNSIDVLHQIATDPFASPAVIYHSLQSIDNKTMYSFGGHLTATDILNPPPKNKTESIRYYRFNFDQSSWAPLQKKNISVPAPLERFWHTTTQFNRLIYLYGGINITGNGFMDFWRYNPLFDTWVNLNQQQPARCGHTSTMTDDGKMIVLGGFDCTNSLFLSQKDKILYPLSTASIFNLQTTQWHDQPLTGNIPNARTFHTAIKSNNMSVIICGGQDHSMEPFQRYMSDNQMTGLLDLKTWKWVIPAGSIYQPFPSSFSISMLVNDTKMVYGLGLNSHTVYDAFYIFDIKQMEWVPNTMIPVTDDASDNSKLIEGHNTVSLNTTMVLSVLSTAFILFLVICWVLRRYRFRVMASMKKTAWNPRAGEPLWAEISRLLFRFSFLAVFIIISTVLILQVQNSPIIYQTHRNESSEMMTPHIRFCFDGWLDQPTSPVLHCTTDFGESCNQYLINITQQVNGHLDYHGTKLDCYLFSGGDDVKLGQNRLTSNGRLIQFYYYGVPSNKSVLYVEFYHPWHDPNIPVYNISANKAYFDGWYDTDERKKFVSSEKINLKTKNIYALDPTKSSQIGYKFERIERMDPTIWNYIGFRTQRDVLHKVETVKHRVEDIPLQDTFLGSLDVFATEKDIIVMREQRAFTVIHGIGIIGGIFGLMIGFQTNLFGYRPRSPWGIVHRWSIGLMRKSLLNGLRTRFSYHQVHIPMVQPVHRRFSEKNITDEGITYESEEERMIRLEERLHMFEFLFQAYYIDDEIFRTLDRR